MKPLACFLLIAGFAGHASATDFHPPVQLESDGKPIKLESPGYAAPCWADTDGDGKKDLLVGQFRSGKITVFSGKDGITNLPAGKWLEAGGKPAEIPGVW